MKVKFPSGETEEIEICPTRLDSLLKRLGVDLSEVLVALNSQVVPEDTIVCNEDELQIIRVVSGG